MARSRQTVNLYAIAFGHGFGLDRDIRVDRPYRVGPFLCGRDERYGAVRVEFELLHGRAPVVTAAVRQRGGMVEHVVVTLVVDVSSVYGDAVGDTVHYLAAVFPRSVDRGSGGIGHELRDTSSRINRIISAVALAYPRTFFVGSHVYDPSQRPFCPRDERTESLGIGVSGDFLVSVLEGYHVVVKLTVEEALQAPEQPCRAVVIYPYRRIDETVAVAEGTADGVLPRALGIVCDSHGEALAVAACHAAAVPVPFAVPLDGLGRPGAVSLKRPAESGGGHRGPKVGPVDHVFSTEQHPVLHLVIRGVIFVVVHEHVKLAVMYVRGGVRCVHD